MENIQLAPMSTTEGNRGYNQLYLQKEGSDFVSIRLTSKSFMPSPSGIMNLVKKSALVRMNREVLAPFLKYAGVNLNPDTNVLDKEVPTTIKGVLQVQESFTPWHAKHEAKTNPQTGALSLLNGRAVYRYTVLAPEGAATYLFGDVIDGKFEAGVVADEEVTEGVETQPTPTPKAEVPA